MRPSGHYLVLLEALESQDELVAANQEGTTGLVAAEGIQKADGGAAAEVEEVFEAGAVDDGGGEGAELGKGAGKVRKPLRGARHGRRRAITAR